MSCIRLRAFRASLLALAVFPRLSDAAEPEIHGDIATSAGIGAAWLDGDRASFQQHLQHKKDGFGGIENLHFSWEKNDTAFKFDARAIAGDENYRLNGQWKKGESLLLDFGYDQFRTYYDGSGGFFGPTNTFISLFDENLFVDRSRVWIEGAHVSAGGPEIRLRYEHATRNGRKDSTHWGDTNLVGAFGTRNIVPTFLDLDETRDVVTLDVSQTTEDLGWAAGLRYDRGELDNARNSRRRPGENAADRAVTTRDGTQTDIFSGHAFVERKVSEKLRLSAGALITKLDTTLEGGRIYGSDYDPVFDPVYARRQARDEGYIELGGGADMKQYVFNLNAVYLPAKNWAVQPAIRFEDQRTEPVAAFVETNIATNLSAQLEDVEAASDKDWKEFTESLEVRYTGMPNWTHSLRGEWIQGDGTLSEDRMVEETAALTIDRDTDYSRRAQKYSLNSNYYVRPGLTLAAQTYVKFRLNDFASLRDNTPPGSADRYPAYITDQDFETTDFNFRVSWRPVAVLGLVTRYDYQRSKVFSTEAGLSEVESSRTTTHIVSQSATWTPLSRLFITGSANVVWDRLATPAYRFVLNGDNNYVNGSFGSGYAIDDKSDVLVDYAYYRANNFSDNSAISQPYGADERQHLASVTWVRRYSETLVVTLKYGIATNRDRTSGHHNDYDAQLIYGKVQHQF